ncbi:MAG: MotA/TolQ/ExbB proton channel family protein [Vicinamibacterales bacterium]
MMNARGGWLSLGGLLLGVTVIGWAHLSMGGELHTFLQPEALAVVFGGTAAALLVSFPWRALIESASGVADLANRRPAPLEALVPAFIGYARKARRHGLMAIEADADATHDGFLSRALSLSASGMAAEVVREALDLEARVCAEREEERAQVLEAAAGYAPTLGIVGAVLGLMRIMQHFSPDTVGAGMAAAFVATIYGVAAANLVFLPLATRLRGRARIDALRRDLVVDGVLALRDGASPAVVEERLAGYLQQARQGVSGAA